MNHLKSLTFTAITKSTVNPIIVRRTKLIANLEDQKALAQNSNYAPSAKRWVKNADGTKQLLETQRRIKPWWRADINGSTILTIRYGFKNIEFEKGKDGIAVPSKDKLVNILDLVIAAVRAGELDAILEQQNKARSLPKAKKTV